MLVRVDEHLLLLALHRDRDDLVRETPALDGRLGLLLRRRGERVLVLARHLVLARDVLGGAAHVAVVERAPQAVADHLVDELPVAEPVSVAPVLHQVRRPRHVLHAAGDEALGVTRADRLRRERDGLQPAAAHLVDRGRGNAFGEARADRGLTRGVLAETGLEHVAHEHLVDGVDAGPAQRLLDGDRAEPGRGNVDERAAECAHRRAHGADDDCFFHVAHSTPGPRAGAAVLRTERRRVASAELSRSK